MLAYACMICVFGGTGKSHSLGILVFDQVLTSEITAPREVFGMAAGESWFADWQVLLIGVEGKRSYITAEGLEVLVDTALAEAPTMDVLIVPGAYDMNALYENQTLMTYIKRHAQEGRWLASNCSGAFILGKAGVLDGRRATTWFGGGALLAETYPDIDVQPDQPVVLDRRRLTSNGGVVSYDAAFVLLAHLASPKQAHEVYEKLQAGRHSSWHKLKEMMP